MLPLKAGRHYKTNHDNGEDVVMENDGANADVLYCKSLELYFDAETGVADGTPYKVIAPAQLSAKSIREDRDAMMEKLALLSRRTSC